MQVLAILILLVQAQVPAGEPEAGTKPDLAATPAGVGAGEEKSAATLSEAVRDLAGLPLDELWSRVAELKETWRNGEDSALEALAEAATGFGEKEKLASASILLGQSEDSLSGRGQVLLHRLARSASDKAVRIAAVRLLREPVQSLWEEAYFVLKDIVDSTDDPGLLIEASLSLWELENYPPVREPLKDLLESGDASLEARAALALAETGYVQAPVDEILQQLRKEPSDRGRRADILLRWLAAEEGRAASSGNGSVTREGDSRLPQEASSGAAVESASQATFRTWTLVIEEVVQLILDHSLHRNKLRLRDLYVAALKGMVSSLDEYSALLDPEDLEQTEAGRLGIRRGLGARLFQPAEDEPLLVVRAYYGGPAHAAGLRSGDRILELNGIPTAGQPLEKIQQIAAGEAGTDLHLWVRHWDEDEPHWISLKRGEVEIPNVRGEILPENLGYIQVRRFGNGTADGVGKLLDHFEEQGLNAILLDLRDNPGGELDEAVKVVDLFVGEREQPIVTELGPAGKKEFFPGPDRKPFHPLFVLVNRGTASSAEVVAAALQDYDRGTLIGQPTYGKGVQQTSLPLSPRLNRLLGGEGRLLLTTSYLYSPRGRPLQAEKTGGGGALPGKEGGVDPDILAGEAEERMDPRLALEVTRVQFSAEVNAFLREHYPEIRSLFEEEGKVWDPAGDPGFKTLVSSLQTRLRPPQLRRAVRGAVRRHLEDDRGKEFAGDIHDDAQLQLAIREALRVLGRDPREIPAYRFLAEEAGKPSPTR